MTALGSKRWTHQCDVQTTLLLVSCLHFSHARNISEATVPGHQLLSWCINWDTTLKANKKPENGPHVCFWDFVRQISSFYMIFLKWGHQLDLQLSERSRYHDFESHPKTLNQRGKCLEMSWKHSSDVYLEKVGWNKKTWWISAESTSRPMNFQSNTSAKMLSAPQICFRFGSLREALSFLLSSLSWIYTI